MDRSADWMAQAVSDLGHARYSLQGGFHEWACFSAQQSAEKAVKAVLQRMGIEAWGHAVAQLLDVVQDSYPVPGALRNRALELDKAYIPTRYPHAHPSGAPGSLYTSQEAERMIEHADEVIRFCQGLLPGI
jgi:HEPN domain-containing protein